MNGPTDVPNSTPLTPEPPARIPETPIVPINAKTDTPLPIPAAVSELTDMTNTEGAVAVGQIAVSPEIMGGSTPSAADSTDRIISGIDLIDFGAGGLLPNHLYVVRGAGGLGKTILGLQFLARGL